MAILLYIMYTYTTILFTWMLFFSEDQAAPRTPGLMYRQSEASTESVNRGLMVIDLERRSCGLSPIDGGAILDCDEGDYTVSNAIGSWTFSCDNLKSKRLYGLTVIKGPHCHQVMLPKSICPVNSPTDLIIPEYCIEEKKWWHIVLDATAIVSTLLLLLILRLTYLFKYKRINERKIIKTKYYKKEWIIQTEYIDPNMPTKTQNVNGVLKTIPNRSFQNYVVPLSKILLFILCCFTPMVQAFGATSDLHQSVKTIYIRDGELITLGNVSIGLADSTIKHPLTLLYYTSSFTNSLSSDYFCTDEGCDKTFACRDSSLTGLFTKSKIEESKLKIGGDFILNEGCLEYAEECWFTSGCWRWKLEIGFGSTPMIPVYRVEESWHEYNINMTGPNDCTIISSASKHQKVFSEKFLILHEEGKTCFCNNVSPIGSPVQDLIGDIQVDSHGNVLTHPDHVLCNWRFRDSPKCKINRSGLKSSLSSCLCNSDFYSIRSIGDSGHELLVPAEEVVEVTLRCKMTYSTIDTKESCGGLIMAVHAITGAGLDAMISLKTRQRHDGHYWKGKPSCFDSTVTVPCDDIGILMLIQWPNECLKTTKGVIIEETHQDTIKELQNVAMRGEENLIIDKGFPNDFAKYITHWFSGLSWTTMISISIVATIVFIKKCI